jgi:hypothetical protein
MHCTAGHPRSSAISDERGVSEGGVKAPLQAAPFAARDAMVA